MIWDGIMRKQRQAEFPAELLVRFVAKNYYDAPDRSRVRFLDIGSGGGANSWYLAHKGFDVTAMDMSPAALGALKHRFEEEKFFRDKVTYWHADITTTPLPENFYDCIVDHNSLCHVERPPYHGIYDALKTGGKFFSVMPRPDTWHKTLEGKGYCKTPRGTEIYEALKMFQKVQVATASYPDQGETIKSWVIVAGRT